MCLLLPSRKPFFFQVRRWCWFFLWQQGLCTASRQAGWSAVLRVVCRWVFVAISRVCGLERRDAGPVLGNSGCSAADEEGLELWLLSASASVGCCDSQELLSRVPPVQLTGRRGLEN